MRGVRVAVLLRRLGAILVGCQLAGCAMQPRDEVRVSVGTGQTQPEAAKDYAALYLPYAMMATAAYTDEGYLDRHHCPDSARLTVAAKTDDDPAFRARVRGWIGDLRSRHWECRFGVIGSLPCPKGIRCEPGGGLEFHVWRRMENGCREVVIAFRGTDKRDIGDWQANFRWLRRFKPKFDQYDQVRVHMADIIARVEANGCAGEQVLVTTTGHSLGGGLAQQAAYAHRRVRYVYAFDPSPVTGFFDVSALQRDENTRGLGIDRAYEENEILSVPRRIIEGRFLPSACDPRVRHVRFNLLTGAPVAQHSIGGLTEQLRLAAGPQGKSLRRVTAYEAARDCGEPRVVSRL